MRDASPITNASAHHPSGAHHLSAHRLASPESSPEPTAVTLARAVLRLTESAAPEYPCLDCGKATDELTLFCSSCWESRKKRRPLRRPDSTRDCGS